jgi:hypothetical protein
MVVPIPSVISPSIHWKWGARNMWVQWNPY